MTARCSQKEMPGEKKPLQGRQVGMQHTKSKERERKTVFKETIKGG